MNRNFSINANNLLCVITIVVMGMICSACPFYEQFDDEIEFDVDFFNESQDTVYVSKWPSSRKKFTMGELFKRAENNDNNILIKLAPGGTICIDKVKEYGAFDGVLVQLIVLSQHTLDSYSKEEIIEKNFYDKKYALTREELEEMDLKIVYTGNDN